MIQPGTIDAHLLLTFSTFRKKIWSTTTRKACGLNFRPQAEKAKEVPPERMIKGAV